LSYGRLTINRCRNTGGAHYRVLTRPVFKKLCIFYGFAGPAGLKHAG